jgi:2-keto-4-pentenoate hydratase
MDASHIREAARLLVVARQTGRLLDGFPAEVRPSSVADAEAIQAATVEELGETIAGWKVSTVEGTVIGGVILGSRVFASPARVAPAAMPLRGVEAEVAFRFDRDLPPRFQPYGYDEVAAAVTAFAAIEIVDSRFRDYKATRLLDRAADCVSNGGFVAGTARVDWRRLDLKNIRVTLAVDGKRLEQRDGGHPAGDPLLPAIDLVNARRNGIGVRAGQVMTTGTFTGLNFVAPGARVTAAFDGLGSAELEFGP